MQHILMLYYYVSLMVNETKLSSVVSLRFDWLLFEDDFGLVVKINLKGHVTIKDVCIIHAA